VRPIVLVDKAPDTLRLEEGHNIRELVPTGAGVQLLLIAQESSKLQEITSLEIFQVELRTGLGEVAEGGNCCNIAWLLKNSLTRKWLKKTLR